MKTPIKNSALIAPSHAVSTNPVRRRFMTLKSISLRRLRYRIRAKLAAGWRADGPTLDITDYATGERTHCWSQAFCHPAAA